MYFILSFLILCSFCLPAQASSILKSTLDDQKSVSLTVYNSNMGLVKDVRSLSLPQGIGEIRFMDVASGITPESVHVRSLTAPDKLSILEQNYEYDLISRQKLLDKYIGQKVKLLKFNDFQGKQDTLEATLVSNNNGEVYEINNEIYLGYPGYGVLPKLPENLIAQPTLTWMFKNSDSALQDVEVSYLTNGVNWRADYVLAVDNYDVKGDLSGWVTLDNQSGATYQNAKLKLVAGQVNRAQSGNMMPQMMRAKAAVMTDLAESAPFKEEGFFEYHLYDLQRPTTIKDKQTKQVSLLEAVAIPLKKQFIVNGQTWWFTQHYNGQNQKQPVNVVMTFKNSEADHLGMPLPAGVVRLYKEDSSGGAQFIGEDRIGHTPKNEDVRIKVGEAFDIVVERKQVSFQQYSGRTYESSWEVIMRNHKKEDVLVSLIEPLSGFSDWDIVTSSVQPKKLDAFTAQFDVPVVKDGETTLTYTVRANY